MNAAPVKQTVLTEHRVRATRFAGGWYQVAFAHTVPDGISAVAIGTKKLVLVSNQGTIRAFSAVCPHRGANLAIGGRLDNGKIVCPFHGYSIHLGGCLGELFAVPEYPTIVVGGMVFVRLSHAHDNGWTEQARLLERDYWCVNGFEMIVHVPMELVIENAFDRLHFRAVHGIRNENFQIQHGAHGALEVNSVFYIPKRSICGNNSSMTQPTTYRGIAISPGLAMTELLGETPYRVITGTTNLAEGGCVVRVTVAFPHGFRRSASTGLRGASFTVLPPWIGTRSYDVGKPVIHA